MDNFNSSPNPVISKLNANNVLTKFINSSVSLEKVGQRIHLTEIQNIQNSKSPLPISSNDHGCTGTPFKHTPSPQSYKMKITPLSRNRRLQEVIYEKQQCTPQSTAAFYNPFELCTEILQLPTVSPHLFKEVVSPSDKEDEKFSWTIDQLAVLHPTNIETSPFNQVDLPSDPEYERKAQEAIDRYFSAPTVVPSPWTNSSHSINIMSGLLSSGSSSQLGLSTAASPNLIFSNNVLKDEKKLDHKNVVDSKACTREVWSQTELSLPPILPEEIEKALKSFCTFLQDQTQQEESDDIANLNNTTLRRKLLFSNEDLAHITPLCSPKNDSACFVGDVINCSNIVSEPLPFEEEETVHPWGVSVIRPSSRLSRSQSPSSLSFIRYSLGGDEELCSSPFNKDILHDVSVKMEGVAHTPREASPVSLKGFSPIRCIPSAHSNATLFCDNKNSLCNERTSPSTPEKSLKPLAVITDEPSFSHIPFKSCPLLSPAIDIAHSQCNSFNSSLLQIHSRSADCSMTKPSDDAYDCCTGNKIIISDELDDLASCIKDPERAQISESILSSHLSRYNGSQNSSSAACHDGCKNISFENIDDKNTEKKNYVKNSEKVQNHESASQSHIRREGTPPTKSMSICPYTKSSPQFSSSPIKNSNFNSSLNYLSASISDEGEKSRLKGSPRFSESPPVSPIAWRMDETSEDLPESSAYKYDQYLVAMGDLDDESNMGSKNSIGDVKSSSNNCEKVVLDPNSQISQEISEDFTVRQQMFMQTTSYMDVDSQPFLEGSTIDEATCEHDTGYNTGISTLQSTNYSLQTTQFTENKYIFDNHAEKKLTEEKNIVSAYEESGILSISQL